MQEFYNNNPFLFLSQEKRDFSYIVLSFEDYKDQVVIPENYIEEAYIDYIGNINQQTQNRISHHMIEKFHRRRCSISVLLQYQRKLRPLSSAVAARELRLWTWAHRGRTPVGAASSLILTGRLWSSRDATRGCAASRGDSPNCAPPHSS